MLIQIPPRILQLFRQLIRRPVIPQYQAQQVTLQPRSLVVHETVARVHHAQVVEEDHIARLQLNLRRVSHRDVMQGVKGTPLDGCQGR